MNTDELIETLEREFYSFDVLQLVAVIEEVLEDMGGGVNGIDTDNGVDMTDGINVKNRPPRRFATPLRGGELKPIDNNGGGRIYFEVDPDLSFPPSDVGYVGIDDGSINNDNPGATVCLPVMNLLGSSSPLPIGFSDYITRGRPDADMYAGFLSIMQNRLHSLWLDAHRKHSLWGGGAVAEKIFASMTGLSIDKERANTVRPYKPENGGRVDSGRRVVDVAGANTVRPSPYKRTDGFPEFALAGLWHLSNRTRSAQGLKELLFMAFGDIPISIEENLGRFAAVSNARPLGGAARLGKNAAAGTKVYDRTSKFRITVGPLDRKTYMAFMPGERNYLLINEIVSIYLNEPVICEISITCRINELPKARLGGENSDGGNELGRTAALGTIGNGTATFNITPC